VNLPPNQLWIMHALVLDHSARTRANSLRHQLAQIRGEIETDLRAAGEGHRLDRLPPTDTQEAKAA
jgi:hypothetical protein